MWLSVARVGNHRVRLAYPVMEGTMPQHRVVAIGGSAGAIEVAKEICRGLPADFAASVLIVIHTARNGPNLLSRVLGAGASIPVSTAVDDEMMQSGRVYVSPADHHLLVIGGKIHLGRGPRENLSRPAIDPLFRSAGLECGGGAIGVLLSGMLNDGAAGLADLKRCGGTTVVQNPSDARASDMPLGALAASDIDYRAPAADLAELITRLVVQPPNPSVPPPQDVALEVEIALGRAVDTPTLTRIGQPVAISCPSCGGVLSQISRQPPLRFRCQIGHAFTAETLVEEQEGAVDEAIRVALRIIEERAVLLAKMAEDARRSGRRRTADQYEERTREYRAYADTLRQAATRDQR